MLGPDSHEHIRRVVDDTVGIFNVRIGKALAPLSENVDGEILRLLAEKIAVLMLAEQVGDGPQVPYISVWQSGKAEIRQVYLSPGIVDLLGYSAEEVRQIGFANLAGDPIVSCFEDQGLLACAAMPKGKAAEDRREEFLGNRVWKGFYRLKRKSGTPLWVMDKAVLTKFVNEKGDDVVYVSEGVLLDADDMMERIRTGR